MTMTKSILSALIALAFASTAQASAIFADWETGTLDSLTFTVDETETSGFIQASTDTATDANFVNRFASEFSTLQFQAPSGGADLLAQINFSEALPDGALLLAFDLDFFNEIFTIESDLGFLTLLEQGETQTGGVSDFPIYDQNQGTLTSVFPTFGDNPFEYSMFDASGVSSLDIGWVNGRNSGSRIAIFLPGDNVAPVPLPASLPILAAGLLALAGLRRRYRT